MHKTPEVAREEIELAKKLVLEYAENGMRYSGILRALDDHGFDYSRAKDAIRELSAQRRIDSVRERDGIYVKAIKGGE